jgi:cytochrome c peroxidase
MRKFIFILVLPGVITGLSFLSCNQRIQSPEMTITQTLLAQIDSFASLCNRLQVAAENNSATEEQLQSLFLQARLAYKKFEWAAEYFEPNTSRLVNGPPVQEVEKSGEVLEPAGLQIIEGYLFPKYDDSRKKELIQQIGMLPPDCEKYKARFGKTEMFGWQVLDAAKLEVFRIITLGVAGFDNPLTLKSMQESVSSLESLQKVLDHYEDQGGSGDLNEKIIAAIKYLTNNSDFNSFDRMYFIIEYGNPISSGITDLEGKLKIHNYKYNRLLNQDAKTIFDSNAFNVNAYAPDHSSFVTNDKIELGRILFSDPILSGNRKRSCRSCHQPEKAFTDGLAKNSIIDKNGLLSRNTPTLINAALQPSLFYDLRVNSLEDQSHSVVQSHNEMHGSLTLSVRRLWQDKKYRQMFLTAFPNEDRNGIDTFEVMNAIGSYIRSLVYLNSRFDEYMRGSKTALLGDEIEGFNLFMGKAKCATCHYLPLFNGTFPPGFVEIEAEVIGVPQSTTKNIIDPDLGRFDIIRVESFRHAFKTPTVRNAARTAPYMHNGVFTTLSQVLDFYNRGGGAGLGIKMDNQTLPADSLRLSSKEKNDIIAFIRSLDSK